VSSTHSLSLSYTWLQWHHLAYMKNALQAQQRRLNGTSPRVHVGRVGPGLSKKGAPSRSKLPGAVQSGRGAGGMGGRTLGGRTLGGKHPCTSPDDHCCWQIAVYALAVLLLLVVLVLAVLLILLLLLLRRLLFWLLMLLMVLLLLMLLLLVLLVVLLRINDELCWWCPRW